jgi:O-antigen/teichoic acid export membrane protein
MERYLKIFRHELISGSFFVFIGTFSSSILSFIFNLFLARTLSYSDYGIFASLISLYALATIPAQSLTAVIVRFSAFYFANNEEDKASLLYRKMIVTWTLIGLAILLVSLLFSGPISSFLRINNSSLVVIIGMATALSYVSIVNVAYLQSLTKFLFMSFMYILGALVKLLLGMLLIFWGYKVFGAIWAVFLMTFVAFLISFGPLIRLLRRETQKDVSISLRELGLYALPASTTILLLSSFISTDVLLVKHFFSAEEAGYYGGLSMIGKAIFYFTGPIPFVMFPLIIKRHTKNQDFKNLFYFSLALVTLPALSITVFYSLFPEFTIRFFLGGREYLNLAGVLGLFGIFMTLYSLNNVVVNFFLSVKKTGIFLLVGIGAFLQIALILLFHESINQVIYASIFSSGLLLILLLLYYVREYGLHNPRK